MNSQDITVEIVPFAQGPVNNDYGPIKLYGEIIFREDEYKRQGMLHVPTTRQRIQYDIAELFFGVETHNARIIEQFSGSIAEFEEVNNMFGGLEQELFYMN